MKGSAGAALAGWQKGFTFTLCIVILVLTLLAVASFAQEWRKSQQFSFTEILPSEAIRLQERVASDVGQMVQADASVKTDNRSTTTLSLSTKQPFKREGEPIARVSDYSSSLPANLRNLGYEAVLDPNNISGSNATVLLTSGNGSLLHSNDGAYDVTTFYYPGGITPEAIHASIYCDKQASSVGEFQLLGSSGSGEGYYYVVNYTEPSGRNYLRNYYAPATSNVSLSISYPDSTLLYFDSIFSPSLPTNRTSIHYTKSSSGALILPFSANATSIVRDYSLFKENITLAAGASAPAWLSDCSRGGCYDFNGTHYMSLDGGVALTGAPVPLPLGAEKISDPWFETFEVNVSEDDGVDDSWYYWTIYDPEDDATFDATAFGSQSYYSINITLKGEVVGDFYPNIYATMASPINALAPNTAYTLSFWSKGAAGRYRIEHSNGTCLDAAGAWTGAACSSYFNATASAGPYVQTTREFSTPESVPGVYLRFFAPDGLGESSYYDSVSLKMSIGMNGGFESHYPESGTTSPPT
jgi:hypothetical protein